jgi:hypothetical protein
MIGVKMEKPYYPGIQQSNTPQSLIPQYKAETMTRKQL